jgi:hypothetical protein
MSEYVLLYRSTAEAHQAAMGTPASAQKSMVKWRAWMNDMSAKGYLKNAGVPLVREGNVVVGQQKTVTDGPFTETKEVVGGFSLVEARDLAHAVQIASGCPILEGGGSVEVRPVLAMPAA